MKTKFFGISAKLALAILAVSGSLFTSCYDSVDGDVTVPPTYPNPVFTVTGQVTDALTGKPIDQATVAMTGLSAASTTTDANGNYQFIVVADADKDYATTLQFTKTGYTPSASVAFTIGKLAKGQAATYSKSIALAPTTYNPLAYTLTFIGSTPSFSSKSFSGDQNSADYKEEVDVRNDKSTILPVLFDMEVDKGAVYTSYDFTGAVAGLEDAVKADLTATYGTIEEIGDALPTQVIPYAVALQAKSSLQTVSSKTYYSEETYKATYGTSSYTIKLIVVSYSEFNSTQYSNEVYHGHGHGHGGDLNAGGGIVSSDN